MLYYFIVLCIHFLCFVFKCIIMKNIRHKKHKEQHGKTIECHDPRQKRSKQRQYRYHSKCNRYNQMNQTFVLEKSNLNQMFLQKTFPFLICFLFFVCQKPVHTFPVLCNSFFHFCLDSDSILIHSVPLHALFHHRRYPLSQIQPPLLPEVFHFPWQFHVPQKKAYPDH